MTRNFGAVVPTSESVLGALTQQRLLDLCRRFGIGLQSSRDTKARVAAHMGHRLEARLPELLQELGREELRSACRAHDLPTDGRARQELQERLLAAAGITSAPRPRSRPPRSGDLPEVGQVVHARQRQWLVEGVHPGRSGDSPRVRLVCLDDDASGRTLEVMWDLELGARVVNPEAHGLGPVDRLDPPNHFGAYLHALRWSSVSAADATRFQAPFRAGIKLMTHQLTPLMKALELPRANLFIADDVGLGKTIEAGLVLQELLLRQQADFVLIACPASICLQWQTEMRRRFGLHFEVMTRKFVAYRRQDRGFGINPWATHNHFIVSHQLLRRPEYRDPLLSHLGPRARKGLLILDEAHVAAPASRSRYAVDSDVTATIRDLAPRFDNRLFLSATPHNGHSNSFSALLELLDPMRFTRGVPITGPGELAPVMVRRLKRDLRRQGIERFPRRALVQLALRHDEGWTVQDTRFDAEEGTTEAGPVRPLSAGPPTELELAEKLARYTELCAPKKGRGRLPFIRLQQRLLSSPEAFARTLAVHAAAVEKKGGPEPRQVPLPDPDLDPELHGVDDETLAAEDDAQVETESRALPTPAEEAAALLGEMRAMAEAARRRPDAKVEALMAWMREHMCPAAGDPSVQDTAWTDRRVIVFTEWADSKRYLVDLLEEAIAHTDQGAERILVFHGGMGPDAREEVQRAFNTRPEDHPARILIATDAAREGINLQAHCADLFHLDLPWNPGRLEQRNGRIDRTLQPAEEVRCHYFVYPDRPEDRVLETLVRKVETVQSELGSLGAVLLGDIERTLADGITERTGAELDSVSAPASRATVETELEATRQQKLLEEEIARAGRRLDASKRALQVRPESLRGVVDVGLKLAGATPLEPTGETADGDPKYALPALDRSWERTLDTLRPERPRGEPLFEWRRRPLREVTFEPLTRLTSEAEQLHLAHPFVKRILDRFLAQGFGAHDLSRATAFVAPDESVARVVAYARLSLFGAGAARLHDEVLAVAAPWPSEPDDATPYRDATTAKMAIQSIEALLTGAPRPAPDRIQARVRAAADRLFAALWPALEAEADAHDTEARNGLAQRARREADELRALLERQRRAIEKSEAELRQGDLLSLDGDSKSLREQQRQLTLDLGHMKSRLEAIDAELETEPAAIADLYETRLTRVVPVGLVVAWPEAMT